MLSSLARSIPRQSRHSISVLTVVIVVTAVVGWHSVGLSEGAPSLYDEYYTLDRSMGFSRNNDWWAVYALGEPTLKKPPMQYWMTAALLELNYDQVLALRLPSLTFATLALIVTAYIARLLLPEHVWAAPASVLFLSTSNWFWQYSTSGMLDAGATFFSSLGILAILVALSHKRFGVFFVIAVFLAGLQKAPTPLAFLSFAIVGVAVTTRLHLVPLRDIIWNRRFLVVVLVALVLGFAWPFFQQYRFTADGLEGSVEHEMFDRFAPTGVFLPDAWTSFKKNILSGEATLRLTGFLGLVVLLLVRRTTVAAATLGIVMFFLIAMLAAGGKVYPRYTLTILPLLAIGAAVLPFVLFNNKMAATAYTVALLALLGGPFRGSSVLSQSQGTEFDTHLRAVIGPLSAAFRKDETFMSCRRGAKVPPGALAVYAPEVLNGFPISIEADGNLETYLAKKKSYDGGPVRGICERGHFEDLRGYLVDPEVTPLSDDMVMWAAEGFRFE